MGLSCHLRQLRNGSLDQEVLHQREGSANACWRFPHHTYSDGLRVYVHICWWIFHHWSTRRSFLSRECCWSWSSGLNCLSSTDNIRRIHKHHFQCCRLRNIFLDLPNASRSIPGNRWTGEISDLVIAEACRLIHIPSLFKSCRLKRQSMEL